MFCLRCSPVCSESGPVLLAAMALVASLIPGYSAPVRADDPGYVTRDLWIGASYTQNMGFVYSGGTLSPFSGLYDEGLKLRASAGYGGYRFERKQTAGTITFTNALIGYQWQLGYVTTKLFGGVSYIDHRAWSPIGPVDDGKEWGPRLQTELWYDKGGSYWASLNLGATTAHNTYAARARVGYRFNSDISLGPEISIDDNAVETIDVDTAYVRGGLFATYGWGRTQVSVSTGVSRDTDQPYAPYVTMNLYTKF